MRKSVIGIGISAVLILAACSREEASPPGPRSLLGTGKGSFVFLDTRLNAGRPLTVYTYLPSEYSRSSPILFVMHGNTRNAGDYRDQWAEIAERRNALLLCPEFSGEDFPRDTQYNMGNMFLMDESDTPLGPVPEEDWTFSLIEPIFDLVKTMMTSTAPGYLIYGHSAGSQFVHRFLFFKPEARVLRAVLANAGWYTLPDFDVRFPYGLGGSPATKENLREAFAKEVTVYLGDADTDTESASLRRTPEAMAQGRHRFERGNNFYEECREAAAAQGVKFNWRLAVAPGIAHSNTGMAVFAEKVLFE
jgi:hypothetical protein